MTILDKETPTKKKKKKKQHYFFYKVLSFILIILTVITCGTLIYQSLFNTYYTISICVVLSIVIIFLSIILNKIKLRAWIKNIISFISIIIIILELLFLIFGVSALKLLSNITDTGYRVETYGVYVLKSSDYKEIEDLDKKNINSLSSTENVYKEALKKLKKEISFHNEEYDTIDTLVTSLQNGKSDAVLYPISYDDVLREEFNDLYNSIKCIYTIDIVEMVDTIESDRDIMKEPFAIYISGIDTSGNVASKARSDVNIIIAVNPNTKEIVLVNTPRDYYVTLASKGKKDKLTHAGLYGVEESLNTLANLYDIEISYYVRVNFTSFIKIVDALGGIELDIPKGFCEQDSNRSKNEKDLICLKKGHQTLNGEEALAFARHRKTLPTGDRARGENQMKVLEAIIDKALSPSIITKYNKLISSLEGRVTTNMTSGEMYKYAKKQIEDGGGYKITSISANGNDSRNVCYSTGSSKAYVMEPDEASIEEIKTSLKHIFVSNKQVN